MTRDREPDDGDRARFMMMPITRKSIQYLHTRLFALLLLMMSVPTPSQAQTVPAGFTVTSVVTGLDGDAVAIALLPDGRFIVANQTSATLDLVVGGVITPEIGTIPNVYSTGSERGLLAVAVDPHWPDSNYVYTLQTMTGGIERLLRFSASGMLSDGSSSDLTINIADVDTLIEMPNTASNHNGGTIRFGSDRSLYLSLGDDAKRPLIQTLTTFNGKILRLSPDPDGVLAVPNPPFPSAPVNAKDEIFAIGLRNPFRFSIDPATDRLMIGDVGQNEFEEVNLSTGGENFGWPRWEADDQYSDSTLIPPAPTFPIFSYSHKPGGNAVLGLLTYRQKDYPNDSSFPPEYEGSHFVSDYYYGPMWNLKPDPYGGWEADTFATGFSFPSDAAIAEDGGMFILEYGNGISKITYDPGSVVSLEATAFLEGPYLGGGVMDTSLRSNDFVPTHQPFADSLFDGSLLEFDAAIQVATVPAGVVDWVLVDLRSGTSAGSLVARQPVFLRDDGALLGVDGSEGVPFAGVDPLSYYVVIRHRNHAAIMSSAAVDFTSGSGTWDFGASLTQAHTEGGDQMSSLGDGKFGMFGGDASIDGQFTATDFNSWLEATKSAQTGYASSDFDLDGQVLASDFNLWLINTKGAHESQVPD